MNHVTAHVVCPFKDLRPDVHKKGVRRPAPENHDFMNRVVVQEACHCTTGAKGVSSDVHKMAGVPE
jgi:hypothetical protein